tara:strand:- start:697 stop:972 length:276 start_codon:yes stop_codon:yes gene_type:complete
MDHHITKLIELLEEVQNSNNTEEIVLLEKKIEEQSLLIFKEKELNPKIDTPEVREKLKALEIAINKISNAQKKKYKLFDDFEKFVESRKIK